MSGWMSERALFSAFVYCVAFLWDLACRSILHQHLHLEEFFWVGNYDIRGNLG